MQKFSSIITRPSDSYNINIFDAGSSKIKDKVRSKLLKKIKQIKEHMGLDIRYVWVIGSSISYQYHDNSDVDINIAIHNPKKHDQHDLNKALSQRYNDKIHIGPHVVNFHIITSTYNYKKSNAIYDLINNHWIKKPKKVNEEDLRKIINSCIDNDRLEIIINSYLNIVSFYKKYSSGRFDSKHLAKFEKSVNDFMTQLDELKQSRRDTYTNKGMDQCILIIYKIAESLGLFRIHKMLCKKLET